MTKFLKIILIILFCSSYSVAQETHKENEVTDTISNNYIKINDSLDFWIIDKNTRILKSPNQSSIWHKIENYDFWKINSSTFSISLITSKMQIWISADSVQVWKENKIGEKQKYMAKYRKINENMKHWALTDSLSLVFFKDTFSLWNVNFYTNYHKLSFLDNVLYMNDTSKLWLISDTLFLWTKNDKTFIWEKKIEPIPWVISSNTKVWNINETIELWQTDKIKNFWKEDKKTASWTKIDTVTNWLLGDTSHLYKLDANTLVKVKKEQVSIWKLSNKKIYSILAENNGKVWKINPPPKLIVIKDSTIKPKEKGIESFFIDNTTHFWNLSDSVKIWRIKEKIEVWEQNNDFKVWQIDDSTKVINLYDKFRLSIISNKIQIWLKNDSIGQWLKAKNAKQWKISGSMFDAIWEINDSLKYTEKEEVSQFWISNSHYKIANVEESWRGIEVWKNFDSLEVWTINEELRFWCEKKKVSIWNKDNSFNFMKVNDSTKVWQVNSEIRLSQVNDVLRIWVKEKSKDGDSKWVISNQFKPIRFQYQGHPMAIAVFNNLQIWQHNKEVTFWKRDTKRKVWTITPILKVYSYIPDKFLEKEKRISNWKTGGLGGIDFSQAFFKNWVKGGENKITLLSSIKLHANYEKEKVSWQNELEMKLGTLKPGENDFRKNEDLLQFNSNFGLKASKNWLISVNSNTSTQFLAGYNYPNDSVAVSNFLSPVKHIGGLGSNFTPNKRFTLFLSPLSLKSTFVRDTTVGQVKFGIDKGKKVHHEIGFQLKTEWKKELWKDVNLLTKLSLFSSYLENPEKIDMEWETSIIFIFNKYIKTTILSHFLYDYDIKVPIYDKLGTLIEKTDALQLKQTLSIGFAYNF